MERTTDQQAALREVALRTVDLNRATHARDSSIRVASGLGCALRPIAHAGRLSGPSQVKRILDRGELEIPPSGLPSVPARVRAVRALAEGFDTAAEPDVGGLDPRPDLDERNRRAWETAAKRLQTVRQSLAEAANPNHSRETVLEALRESSVAARQTAIDLERLADGLQLHG